MEKKIGFTSSVSFACLEDLENIQGFHKSLPLGLNYCGEEQCTPSHRWEGVRKQYLLHVVESGKGILRKGDESWNISPGNAFLILPGEEASYEADAEEPWRYVWIGFGGFRAGEFMKHIGLSGKNPVTTIEDTSGIVSSIRLLLKKNDTTLASEMYRTGLLYEIFGMLMEKCTEKTEPKEEQQNSFYVKQAIEFFVDNYSRKIRIEEVARSIGISRGHLTRCFNDILSVSPQEYLMNLRMERASRLLRTTVMPINEIAQRVGYPDPLAFSKTFKSRYKASPKEYRNMKTTVEKADKKGYVNENPL